MRYHSIFSRNCSSLWQYKCNDGLCKKELIAEHDTDPVALSVCQLSCSQGGTLWPKPTGHLSTGKSVVQLNPDDVVLSGISTETIVGQLLERNLDRLKENLKKLGGPVTLNDGGTSLVVHFDKGLKVDDAKLTLNTDESYTLRIALVNGQVSRNNFKKS